MKTKYILQEVNDGQVGNFEYYTDKPAQKGDPVTFQNLLSGGINPFKNKNLIKSLSAGTTLLNVNYEYDETGKLKTATLTGSTAAAAQELRYQYSCN